MTYTEEDFNTMGRIAAVEVVDASTTIVRELSDQGFVAKLSAGEGRGDADFQARSAELVSHLEFLRSMLSSAGER